MDNNIIRINKVIFKEENKNKNIDDYFSKNTEKNLIIYCRKMLDNIYIDINGNNYIREYNKIDISFNIYTLFDKKNQLELDCSEYGSIDYILKLFEKLYETKDINHRWRKVNVYNNLPNFNELFPIFKNQYNIKSNNYIVKAWIPRSLIDVNTIGEDPNFSLNTSSYWNTHYIYILIDNLYYLWTPEKWWCREDAPNNDYYFIKPSLITDNIINIYEKIEI